MEFQDYIVPGIILLIQALIIFLSWKNQASKISGQVKEAYKERVEQLEETVEGMKVSLSEQQQMIDQLESITKKKDLRIDELEKIVQLRNPEFARFLKNNTAAIREMSTLMKLLHEKFDLQNGNKEVVTVQQTVQKIKRSRKTN